MTEDEMRALLDVLAWDAIQPAATLAWDSPVLLASRIPLRMLRRWHEPGYMPPPFPAVLEVAL